MDDPRPLDALPEYPHSDFPETNPRIKRLETEKGVLRRTLLTVGHELRTPLASVVAYTDLLARNAGGNLSETDLNRLAILRRNAMVLDLLIGDLSRMTELGTDSMPIRPSRFEACSMLREVCETVQPFFDTRGQTLIVVLPDEDIWTTGDRERLQQVAVNLLINASKFSPGSSQIDLTAQVHRNRLHVMVTDRGAGLDEDEQARMFETFFTAGVRGRSSAEGLGLGLYISRNIVEAHGGRMTVTSQKGKGATIGFNVPLEFDAIPVAAAPRGAAREHSPSL